MTILRSNNFEAGVAAGTAIDSTVSATGGNAFTYFNGAPVYSATHSRGALGLDCSGNAVAAAVGWAGLGTKTFQFRSDFRIAAAPSTTIQTFTARNASNYIIGLNLNTARKLQVAHWAGAVLYTTTTTLAVDTWYRWELWGEVTTAGAGILHFALFLGDSTTPLETFDTTTADLQSTNITETRIGKHSTSGTLSLIIDNFAMGDTAAALGPAANVPPTVSVGASQNVAAGATVSLTSTATDVDGTVASRAWSFDYPTTGAPTLTGASSANASFTAGAAGSYYVLRHTATDDTGASSSATTEIRVPASGSVRPVALNATGVGTWTRAGSAATDGAAVADELSTTYNESPSVSSTEATRRYRLAPSAARSAAQIAVDLSQDSTGTLTATVRLYEGTTLRQTWTVTTAGDTSIVSRTVTLSPATIAAITDWANLYVEVGAAS